MSNALTPDKPTDALSWFGRFVSSLKGLLAQPKRTTVDRISEGTRSSPEAAAVGSQIAQTTAASPPAAAPAPAPAPAAVAQLRQAVTSSPTASAPAEGAMPTLTIGQIGTRLGFVLPSAFLESLGFVPTRHRGAVLFHEEQFPAICEAIVGHVCAVREAQAA